MKLPSLKSLGSLLGRGDSQQDAPLTAPGVLRVLMVCSGNICRSPTAEGVLRGKLRQAGLGRQIAVDSAGTHGFHVSEAPDPRAVQSAKKRGYDLTKLRARPVEQRDFLRFHWIFAMDQKNLIWLEQNRPDEAQGRVALFLQQAGSPVHEVPDPYYGGAEGFERVLDLIEPACDTIARQLARSGPPADLGPF
jgi:protein-tyrosine phosphatase